VKRILAFSSVVQSGFILMGIINLDANNSWSLIYYLTAYALASIVTFIVVYFVEEQSGSDHLDSFAGLSKSNPVLAVVMSIALISLAGVPLTAGFMSKLYVLRNINSIGFTALMVIALVLAAVSFYYYFKIINAMFSPSGDRRWSVHFSYSAVLVFITIAIIFLGVMPGVLHGFLG
jgi:NADH-quinone oxidoreductase subunit N